MTQDDVNIDAERGWPVVVRDESQEQYNATARSIHHVGLPGETSVPPRIPPVQRAVDRGTTAPPNDVAEPLADQWPNPREEPESQSELNP